MMSHKFLLNKYLLTILVLVIIFPLNVFARVTPTREFFVNDYANVLSYETCKYLQESSEELYKIDGTQVVVVTVLNLAGESIEDYANGLFRDFGIGEAKKDNGLLILFALEERSVRVEVGYGLEGLFNDAKVGRYLDKYAIPYFKGNDFDTGIKNLYNAFYNELSLSLDRKDKIDEALLSASMSSRIPEFLFVGFLGIIIGYFYALAIEKNNSLKGISFVILVSILVLSNFLFPHLLNIYIRCFIIPFLVMFLLKIMGFLNFSYSDTGDYQKNILDRNRVARGISSGTSFFKGGGGSSGGGGASRKF